MKGTVYMYIYSYLSRSIPATKARKAGQRERLCPSRDITMVLSDQTKVSKPEYGLEKKWIATKTTISSNQAIGTRGKDFQPGL